MPITIEITADTVAELNAMLAELAKQNSIRTTLQSATFDPDGSKSKARVKARAKVEAMDGGDEAEVELSEGDFPGPGVHRLEEDGDAPPGLHYLPPETTLPPKRGRGRPPKAEAEEAPAAPAPAENTAPLTPTGLIETAVKTLATLFINNPGAKDDILKLQTKYGVRKFIEVPQERATELTADVAGVVAKWGTP